MKFDSHEAEVANKLNRLCHIFKSYLEVSGNNGMTVHDAYFLGLAHGACVGMSNEMENPLYMVSLMHEDADGGTYLTY